MSESNDRPRDWLDTELDETLEEMFELEFSEPMMDDDIRRAYNERNPDSLDNRTYFRNLLRLQTELIKLQDWVEHTGAKVLVICEGRDSAGKGGVIKRIVQRLNPRVARVVALPKPTEREQSQWYFQRYVPYLPAGGEIVLFDRSWYNRAGVERVMGFCEPGDYLEFMRQTPEMERMLTRTGIQLYKFWFSVTQEEQRARFQSREIDPLKRWKLSHDCRANHAFMACNVNSLFHRNFLRARVSMPIFAYVRLPVLEYLQRGVECDTTAYDQ